MTPGLPFALDTVALKATLVLVGALVVAFGLRRASGTSRHTLWTATTIALLSLPLLEAQLPRLSLAWLPAPAIDVPGADEPASVATGVAVSSVAPSAADRLIELPRLSSGAVESAQAPRGLGFWLAVVWLTGVVCFAIPVLIGVLRSRRLMARAVEVEDDRLLDRFGRACALVGVRNEVALRLTDRVRTPMTGGVFRAVVLLPESALAWSDDCLDAVLRHELVHVRQRDALRQLASRLSVAWYWFHPLAWRAARLGALARELACDESVLRLGTRPSRYARHLLDLADPAPVPMAPALVRLDHPHLEERVMAILRASPPSTSRRLGITAAMLIFTWTAVVAAASPTVRGAVSGEVSAASASYPVETPAPGEVELPALALLDELEPLPALQVPVADCEFDRDSRTSSDSRGPARTFTTNVEGTRVCATIRGANDDRDGFLPRGRLPAGVILTLGSSNADGTRRMEISGSGGGNQHRWFVDGRERTFDAAAGQWRDAMLDLIGTLTERHAADRARAVEAMGVARRNAEAAASDVRRAQLAEMRAMTEARAGGMRAAGRVDERRLREMEVAGHAMAADVEAMGRHAEALAEVAESHARIAEEMAVAGSRGSGRAMVAPRATGGRLHEVPVPPVVAGVHEVPVAPRVAGRGRADVAELRAREVDAARMHEREVVEAHRVDLERRQSEMRERVAEVRERAAVMEREHARMVAELDRERPVVARGRGVGAAGVAPGARGAVIAPRAVPSMSEDALDPRAADASARLRRAIRVTGET